MINRLSNHVPDRVVRIVSDPLHRFWAFTIRRDAEGWSFVYTGDSHYIMAGVDEDEREVGKMEAYTEAFVVVMCLIPVFWSALMLGSTPSEPTLRGLFPPIFGLVSCTLLVIGLGELGNVEIEQVDEL